MFPLLILRCETLCLIILIYLLIAGQTYKVKKDNLTFTRLCLYALIHVIFDIVTIWTVNHTETVPVRLNDAAHLLFYLSALLFSFEVMFYTLQMCVPKTVHKKILIAGYSVVGAYLLSTPFLRISYEELNGTWSSTGLTAYVGYSLALVFFICTIVILFTAKRKIPLHVRKSLIPIMFILLVCEVSQIFVRELLFTGAAVTIVTVGFFFSLENPAEEYRRKLQYDTLTGVKSRHSYEEDIKAIDKKFSANKNYLFSIVFCDLNNLKGVNDLYGHEEGDNYITGSASLMLSTMKSAANVYRMGGDEFMILFDGVEERKVKSEVNAFIGACAEKSVGSSYPFSVAIGCATSGPQYTSVRDVLRVADYLMYQNKAEIKKEKAYLSIGPNREKLNISGLTDRMFEVFSRTSKRNYFFICNTETNVSRLSPDMVEYFGLESEFIYSFNNVWIDLIHPDDRDAFREDDMMMLTGKKTSQLIEYRVRNKEGRYVVCTCRAFIMKGIRGEPDMYAGTIENHGIADDIDPVTGLRNDDVFIEQLNGLIEAHTAVALLRVSIMDFSRINMLYGFSGGNELLRQFVLTVNRMLPAGCSLFRLNGTNFVACLPGASRKDVQTLYEKIRELAAEGIPLQNSPVPIQIAGGAYMLENTFDGSAGSVYSSLIYAHDRSEHNEHGRLVYYNEHADGGVSRNYKLLSRVHADVLNNNRGFFLRYQPILRTGSNDVYGVEALVRWNDDVYGEVLPNSFLPWLQNDPCFIELGTWILRRALTDGKHFLKEYPHLRMDVNVTAIQLQSSEFRNTVAELLKETGFPAENLCLEFTEDCYEMDIPQLRELVDFFHSIGVKVALDNVTVQYPAIGVLLELPIDEIKLDRQFVREVPVRKSNQVLLNMLLEASRSLHFDLCFEGIEDSAAHEYFRQYAGINYQGFYYSMPMTDSEFENFRSSDPS